MSSDPTQDRKVPRFGFRPLKRPVIQKTIRRDFYEIQEVQRLVHVSAEPSRLDFIKSHPYCLRTVRLSCNCSPPRGL